MSGNPYKAILDQEALDSAAKPPDTSAAPLVGGGPPGAVVGDGPPPQTSNRYAAVLDDEAASARESAGMAFDRSWAVASPLDPNREAEIQKIAGDRGMDPGFVRDNYDEIKKAVNAAAQPDYENIRKTSPVLAAWLSDPRNAAVAHDDVPKLSALEWAMKSLPLALSQGVAGMEAGIRKAAGAAGIFDPGVLATMTDPGIVKGLGASGFVTPEQNDALIAGLEQKASVPIDESNPLKKALVETARFAPVLGGLAASSTLLGPAGGAAAAATYFGVTGYGDAKYKMAAIRDKSGNPLPEDLQQFGAVTVGTASAALGVLNISKLAKVLPGADAAVEDAVQTAVQNALFRPTVGKILRARIKAFGEAAVTSSLVSGAMTATQILGDKAVVAASGQDAQLPGFSENLQSLADSLYTGALIGSTVGLAGSTWNIAGDAARIARAGQAEKSMTALGVAAKESALGARAPEKLGDLATAAADAGSAPEHVFIPLDRFVTLFQSEKLDPEQTANAAAQKLGIQKEYAAAKATGGDVAIPFGTYVEKIAGTDLHAEALKDVRFDPGDPTPREAAQMLADAPARAEAAAGEIQAEANAKGQDPADVVYDRINTQLLGVGVAAPEAHSAATLWREAFRAISERAGLGTAADLFGQYDVSVSRGTPGGVLGELAQGERGSIQFTRGGRSFAVTLSPEADASTFLHESGHAFFEILGHAAENENAPAQIRADHEALLDWMGVKTHAEATPEHLEKFARGFEAFLREGKAPSVELASAFSRFRAWLVSIYRHVTQLGVELNPEVRDIMRRLVATDDQIGAAEEAAGVQPLFKTALEGSATEAEFAAYEKGARRADDEARTALHDEVQQQVEREATAWWKERRDETRARVEAEFNARPEYRAAKFLRTGKAAEGDAVPPLLIGEDGEPVKMSSGEVKAIYGPETRRVLRALGPASTVAEGGVHPDVVAEAYGFSSGQEMIDKIVAERPSKTAIEDETSRRMVAEHGDILNDGTMQDRSVDIVYKVEARQRQILAEERFLRRLMDKQAKALSKGHEALVTDIRGEKAQAGIDTAKESAARRAALDAGKASPANMKSLRADAREWVGLTRVRDINPRSHSADAQRAYQRVAAALAKGDYGAALVAQRERLTAYAMFLEASEAKRADEANARFARAQTTDAATARLQKAGQIYVDQRDKLLERFDFKVSLTGSDRRQSLSDWIAEEKAADRDPVVPQYLLNEMFRTSYKNLTHDQFQGLRNALENITTQAHLKNTLLVKGKRISFAALRDELVSQIRTLPSRRLPPISSDSTTLQDKIESTAASWRASLRKIEEVCVQIDGGDTDGPAHRLIFQPAADAEAVSRDMAVSTLQKVTAYLEAMPKEIRDRGVEKTSIPGTGVSLTRSEMMVVALNTMNDSNYQRLLAKGKRQFKTWDAAVVERIVSNLTKPEWNYAQGMVDVIESFWPQIEAQQKRLTGLAPEKIEARPFTRKFSDGTEATYRGGYYPVVYDRLESPRLATQVDPAGDALFSQAYQRATTPHGWTNERVDGYTAPIRLSFDELPKHIAAVIHDLSHREALISMRKLVTDPEVRLAMAETIGEPQMKQFMPWLQYLANRQTPPLFNGDTFWGNAMRRLRINATTMGIGFSFTVPAVHLVGFSQAMDLVPPAFMGAGMRDFYSDPARLADWIDSKSGTMRHFTETADRDLSESFDEVRGKTDLLSDAKRLSMLGFGYVRKGTGYPTWLGAFQHASASEAEGGLAMDEATAIEHADAAVRRTIGSAGAKDLAPVQRGNEAWKLATMFYSWGSTLYNRLDTLAIDTKAQLQGRGPGVGNILARSLFIWLIPAVMAELLRGRPPKEDESWAKWAMEHAALYPVETIPVVRDIANALDRGTDPTFSPVFRAGEAHARTVKGAIKLWNGDEDMSKEIFNFGRSAGYVTGWPVDAPLRSARYLWDVRTGDERPDNPFQFLHGVAYGPPPKR